MRGFMPVLYDILLTMAIVILLSGCAGLSQQYKASIEGISMSYTVNKEQFINPKAKVFISLSDERLDREVIGEGAKPSVGPRVLGYVAFGVIYAAMPDQPTLKDRQDPVDIFNTAIAERLSKNGIALIRDHESDALTIDLLVRQFKLDFNFGKWTGEVGYVARVKKDGEIICEDKIYERATASNLYGFGSGERAINEAFNRAINRLDINSCFSKMHK